MKIRNWVSCDICIQKSFLIENQRLLVQTFIFFQNEQILVNLKTRRSATSRIARDGDHIRRSRSLKVTIETTIPLSIGE